MARGSEVIRRGLPQHPLTDLYYRLMAGGWGLLLGFITALYLAVNLVFAALYMFDEEAIVNAAPGDFVDAFYFSLQTMSTIGYGHMYPQSDYAETLVLGEAVVGLLCTAVATGLVFTKFARPRARVIFSDKMLFNTMNGEPVAMFRVANARGNELVEASIHVSVLLPQETVEGYRLRRLHDLKLQRSRTPIFALSWLIIHELTQKSPLHGLTREDLSRMGVRIVVSLTGVDGTFSQLVHGRHVYLVEDLVWDAQFADVLRTLESGALEFDMTRFHDTEPARKPSSHAAQ